MAGANKTSKMVTSILAIISTGCHRVMDNIGGTKDPTTKEISNRGSRMAMVSGARKGPNRHIKGTIF